MAANHIPLSATLEANPVPLAGTTTFSVTVTVDENTSDGYHTFRELYQHRYALFAVLCRHFNGWKSWHHATGEMPMYPNHFIAGIETPTGTVRYHVAAEWWNAFQCATLGEAPPWDGTSGQGLQRLGTL